MNTILVLCALVTLASARPDVSLGYKYPQPGSGVSGSVHYDQGLLAPSTSSYAPTFASSGLGISGVSGGGLGVSSVSSGGLSVSGISGSHHHVPSKSYVPSTYSHGTYQTFGVGGYQPTYQAPIVTKHFYIHSAPEEQADQVTKHITIGQPQKNYRVVFIKAPSSSGAGARITASYAPTEDKTVIYVLSKKPEDIQIENIATPAPTEPSKPEVFFIKYKTPEEAVHAQQQIQAQYDALGGSSQVSNEGQAPITSVVGILGGHSHHDVSGNGLVSGTTVVHDTVGTGSYLPPSHK